MLAFLNAVAAAVVPLPAAWMALLTAATNVSVSVTPASKRKLDARLDPPVLPTSVHCVGGGAGPTGLQARRRVVALGVFDDADHEVALAVLEGVVGGTGIDLRLAIAPAPAAEIEVPVQRIGRRARRSVELIAPHQLPAAGDLCRRSCAGQP